MRLPAATLDEAFWLTRLRDRGERLFLHGDSFPIQCNGRINWGWGCWTLRSFFDMRRTQISIETEKEKHEHEQVGTA